MLKVRLLKLCIYKLMLINKDLILIINIGYANPDLVNHLYEDFKKKRYDIDMLRKKRNEHT